MSRDETYRPRNYRKQNQSGDDLWQIDGQIDIGSAGVMSFYDEDYTGTELQGIARAGHGAYTFTNLSTGSTVLSDFGGSSPPVIPSTYGCIFLSVSSTMTNGSARLFSAKAGQLLHIRFTVLGAGSTASVLLYCSGNAGGLSGVRVLGSTGSDCSSLSIRQSAASWGWISLIGIADGIWAVAGGDGQHTERMA